MAIIKIEITQQHLTLLKYLKVNSVDNKIVLTIDSDDDVPVNITDDNKYEYINLVLNGVQINDVPKVIINYTLEQKAEWDLLYTQLPIALSVILQKQSFLIGKFKASWHDRVWKDIY